MALRFSLFVFRYILYANRAYVKKGNFYTIKLLTIIIITYL